MKRKALLIVILCIYLTTKAQWKGLDTLVSYPAQDVANLIHTKDITGDGVGDLTVFYTAGHLSFDILTGSDKGKFTASKNVYKEDNYFLSDIGHLNGDSNPDLVLSSYWNNGFKIFFGKGGGNFEEGIYMPTGVHGRAVKCVDINKDGITDIVATTSGSGQTISLHIFIGKGDGTFQPKKTFTSVLDTSKDIVITDKNSDGLLDVVVTSSFPWIVMFMQNTNGDFVPSYYPTFQSARVNFSDINRDGADDMVLLYSSFDNTPGSDSLVIKLNSGGVSFSESIRIDAFEGRSVRPYLVQSVDINKDGYKDLFFNHTDMDGYPTDTVFYLLGKENNQFRRPDYFTLPAKLATLQFADVDGNGHPDLIASCDDKKIYIGFNGAEVQDSEKLIFRLYPNPAGESFTIESSFEVPYTIHITNLSGQIVHQQQATQSKLTISPKLPRALYLVTIRKGSSKVTRPIIIR